MRQRPSVETVHHLLRGVPVAIRWMCPHLSGVAICSFLRGVPIVGDLYWRVVNQTVVSSSSFSSFNFLWSLERRLAPVDGLAPLEGLRLWNDWRLWKGSALW